MAYRSQAPSVDGGDATSGVSPQQTALLILITGGRPSGRDTADDHTVKHNQPPIHDNQAPTVASTPTDPDIHRQSNPGETHTVTRHMRHS
eukprot:18003-Eustigmatos_ZCMA.PRE.1